jgi:N-acetylmuramoyl-L-alanine amidase
MFGRFARSRELRMKQTIHRGIFEENLRLLGRSSARIEVRRRLPRAGRVALFCATLAGVTLFTGTPVSPIFFPVQQIQAGFTAPAPVGPPALDPRLFKGARNMPLSRAFDLGVRTIIIDPGHGGEDAGAVGRGGTREKDAVLDIARRLRRRLSAGSGTEVLLTRDGDQTVPLAERVAIAHADHADLFVSIHLNFVPKKPINLVETFYFGPASDAAAAEQARRENSGQGPGMSELREIIERLETQMRREESPRLAAAIQASVLRTVRNTDAAVLDYGTKRGPFAVLNQADVPAVLAEIACLSNPEEETRLALEEHREGIAAALESGILDYLRNGGTTHESRK